ncbi:YdcF family protein [Aerococcaceae bacterium DSM 111176]|nr:YdcF family protein [Aerococcaceae bacterium DSM 111176]
MKLKALKAQPKIDNNRFYSHARFNEMYIASSFKGIEEFKGVLVQLKSRNYGRAINILNQLIKEDKQVILARRLLGEIYFYINQFEAAWIQFDQILKEIRNDNQALTLTIIFAQILGDHEEAQTRLNTLQFQNGYLFEKLVDTNNFIETNKTRNNFEEYIQEDDEIDILVVYGQRLEEDGTIGVNLERILMKTLSYAKKYPESEIMLCGAAVHNSYIESIYMNQWLVDQGVDNNRITINAISPHTVGNSLEASEMIISNKFKSVCVIALNTHLPRAWMSLVTTLKKKKYSIPVYGAAYEVPETFEISADEQFKSYFTVLYAAELVDYKYYK